MQSKTRERRKLGQALYKFSYKISATMWLEWPSTANTTWTLTPLRDFLSSLLEEEGWIDQEIETRNTEQSKSGNSGDSTHMKVETEVGVSRKQWGQMQI